MMYGYFKMDKDVKMDSFFETSLFFSEFVKLNSYNKVVLIPVQNSNCTMHTHVKPTSP